MRIVKLLLVGSCITTVSVSFADSMSFTFSSTYKCPGMAPISTHNMSGSKVNAAIAKHLSTMTKIPSEYKCTIKSTSSARSSKGTRLSTGTGFLILKNPSVVGNEKSGYILMADKLIRNNTTTSKGTGPLWKYSSTTKDHNEISKFNSLKNQHE